MGRYERAELNFGRNHNGEPGGYGFEYDQAAIAAYIESEVPADDMSFASTLQMMVQGQGYQLDQMSKSSTTAHCTQIGRVAKSYKFIQ